MNKLKKFIKDNGWEIYYYVGGFAVGATVMYFYYKDTIGDGICCVDRMVEDNHESIIVYMKDNTARVFSRDLV